MARHAIGDQQHKRENGALSGASTIPSSPAPLTIGLGNMTTCAHVFFFFYFQHGEQKLVPYRGDG